jgi:hypothetical protein
VGHLLISMLADNVLENVLYLRSGRQLWKHLRDTYAGTSIEHICQERRVFHTLTLKDDNNLESHLAQLRNSYEKVLSFGV